MYCIFCNSSLSVSVKTNCSKALTTSHLWKHLKISKKFKHCSLWSRIQLNFANCSLKPTSSKSLIIILLVIKFFHKCFYEPITLIRNIIIFCLTVIHDVLHKNRTKKTNEAVWLCLNTTIVGIINHGILQAGFTSLGEPASMLHSSLMRILFPKVKLIKTNSAVRIDWWWTVTVVRKADGL